MKLCYEGINLKGFVNDNQETSYPTISVTPDQVSEIEKDYHNWYINPNTMQPYRKPQCDNRYIKFENNVFVEMTQQEKQAVDNQEFLSRKQSILESLQQRTYNYIASKMPDWRLRRYERYFDLALKLSKGDVLTDVEQQEYDLFPDRDETHAEALQYASLVLAWVSQCRAYHNELYIAIQSAETQQELDEIKINYPEYPFEFEKMALISTKGGNN